MKTSERKISVKQSEFRDHVETLFGQQGVFPQEMI